MIGRGKVMAGGRGVACGGKDLEFSNGSPGILCSFLVYYFIMTFK